jgi:hypothetical protein
MPNVNAPRGLIPLRHNGGGLVRTNRYEIASGLAANIFRGDPVKPTGTNNRITVAAAGDRLQGVAHGFEWTDVNGAPRFEKFWPTGTTVKTGTLAYAHVYDDPNIVYEIQTNGTGAVADTGACADVTMATAGSTITGQSGAQIDQTTVGAIAQLKLIKPVLRDATENAFGANVKWEVMIAEHYMRGDMTTI